MREETRQRGSLCLRIRSEGEREETLRGESLCHLVGRRLHRAQSSQGSRAQTFQGSETRTSQSNGPPSSHGNGAQTFQGSGPPPLLFSRAQLFRGSGARSSRTSAPCFYKKHIMDDCPTFSISGGKNGKWASAPSILSCPSTPEATGPVPAVHNPAVPTTLFFIKSIQ